ncbi:pentapeptide repeat-containing protein [Phormidium sp. CCY1219]|jgi:uncharacterized protein YjbI with pentapeptide repeats|uniref:pentapeptide repeat-containing protein n=1 Tax=Phormidium sp. CCY1219 TaxID=2886104 RepID=UPI002D1F171E|nr:pentapeptide repeat-containing protein [Phormidium sp. CCY1219]MEB3828932.1 pentapeptide repeat-containing protein [Phormidium sp. CCY1219]
MEAEELVKQFVAGTRDFQSVNLTEVNLSQVNLSEINLSGANLSIANLSGADLSGANLSHSKLNVAKLNSAHLCGANLNGADLNVANLIRADLRGTLLIQASLIRAELMRAELSGANLTQANLNGANLREAKLRQAYLVSANVSEADMRGTSVTGANLEQANLRETNLSGADLSGANLRNSELRQTDLSHAKLMGVDLSGANLRWADLSEACLRGADLSGAKLSGANLRGADLSHANLLDASLVYADLTHANMIQVDWTGADISGATLTGTKLYSVSRFGLKTEGITCEWIDLSPNGDRTQVYRFTPEMTEQFFHQTLPTVEIIIDSPLDQDAHLALALAYHQIAQRYPDLLHPPNIEVGSRRTTLRFKVNSDKLLFSTAYVAIVPFKDATVTQENIEHLVEMIESPELSAVLDGAMEKVKEIRSSQTFSRIVHRGKFFQSPTETVLTNSSDRTLDIHHNPHFGKRLINVAYGNNGLPPGTIKAAPNFALPPVSLVVNFIKGLHLSSNAVSQ